MWKNKVMVKYRGISKFPADFVFDTALDAQFFIEHDGLIKFGSDNLLDFILVPVLVYEKRKYDIQI